MISKKKLKIIDSLPEATRQALIDRCQTTLLQDVYDIKAGRLVDFFFCMDLSNPDNYIVPNDIREYRVQTENIR